MKKSIILSALLIASSCLNGFAAQIFLQHNGDVTIYESTAFATALSKAAAGDTLFLSDGTFTGNLTLNKAVTIIGAGQSTRIDGSVTVSISGTPTLTAHLLDAMSITGDIKVSAAVNGIKIRKCSFGSISFSGNVSDVLLDRCFVRGNCTCSTYVQSMNVVNSKIQSLQGYGNPVSGITLVNCNIYQILCDYNGTNYYSNGNPFKGYIFNSIIYNSNYTSYSYRWLGPDAFLVSSLIRISNDSYLTLTQYSTMQNCITSAYTDWSMDSNTMEINKTTDDLKNHNCLGNDGTVMGIYGGTTPFTLVPAVPTVTESTVKVDPQNKKLEVSLKVSTN